MRLELQQVGLNTNLEDFEDIEPGSSYEINLGQEDVERLKASNLKFKKLRFAFRENKTQKITLDLNRESC